MESMKSLSIGSHAYSGTWFVVSTLQNASCEVLVEIVCACTCDGDLAIWRFGSAMHRWVIHCWSVLYLLRSGLALRTRKNKRYPLIVEASAPWFCNPSDRL